MHVPKVLFFETQLLIMQLAFCSSFYSKMKAVGVAKIFTDFWSVFDLVNIVVLFAVFAIRMLWLLAVLRVDWQGSTWAVAFT